MNRNLNSNTKSTVRGIESVIEILFLSVAYFAMWKLAYSGTGFPAFLGKGKYALVGLYAFLIAVVMGNTDGFAFGDLRRLEVALAQWIGLLVVNAVTFVQLCLIGNAFINPLPIIVLAGVQVFITVVFIYLYAWVNQRLYMPHDMLMIVGNLDAAMLKLKMDSRKDKYIVKKLISVDVGYEKICQEILNYESVIINDVPAEMRNDLLKFCYDQDIRAYVVPKLSDIIIRGADDVTVFDTPLIVARSGGLTPTQRFMKRAMDIVLSLIAMIIASPVMLIVALAIKLDDGGPVFYKQKRVTIGGKEFDILKFRSMIVNAEKDGKSIPATGGDPRITRVGKIIRACRVDELPQILNILKGDMSVVGPRPERTEHVEKYSEEIPEFNYRLKTKGGLTGYAQIYGKYNTSAYDKLRLDLIYIENYSLLLDIKLILMTLRIILKKESTEGFDEARKNEERLKEMIGDMTETAASDAEQK